MIVERGLLVSLATTPNKIQVLQTASQSHLPLITFLPELHRRGC